MLQAVTRLTQSTSLILATLGRDKAVGEDVMAANWTHVFVLKPVLDTSSVELMKAWECQDLLTWVCYFELFQADGTTRIGCTLTDVRRHVWQLVNQPSPTARRTFTAGSS